METDRVKIIMLFEIKHLVSGNMCKLFNCFDVHSHLYKEGQELSFDVLCVVRRTPHGALGIQGSMFDIILLHEIKCLEEKMHWSRIPRVNRRAQYAMKSSRSMFDKFPTSTDTELQQNALSALPKVLLRKLLIIR